MKTFALGLAVVIASTTPLAADTPQDAMFRYLNDSIQGWAHDAVIVSAIQTQNTETTSYDQSKIDELDLLWRGFLGMNDADINANVISSAAAAFLRDQVAASDGAITEAFIMDAQGLNVAASVPTSDYWQGDEAKFTQTFPLGPDTIHIGDIELDASTGLVQGQVSLTITDQATGEPVGTLTVGINLSALM